MPTDFVCVVCDKTFSREAIRGNYVQRRKLCDHCAEIHKWCSWGRHAPLRSQFSAAKSGDGLQFTCNACWQFARGSVRGATCFHCGGDFVIWGGRGRHNGRNVTLCDDCHSAVKFCQSCETVKPRGAFYPAKDKANGLSGRCRDCHKANWFTLPDERRTHSKRRKFGLSHDDYEAMRGARNDMCAICGQVESVLRCDGKPKSLAIDHCHTTGLVRDLLCVACNQALGKMADDPARLRAAADYVERWAAEHAR